LVFPYSGGCDLCGGHSLSLLLRKKVFQLEFQLLNLNGQVGLLILELLPEDLKQGLGFRV
jgi:hypothetical protein